MSASYSAVGAGAGFGFDGTSGNNLPFGAALNLGTLGSYGGPTQTIPLLAGSAALDAGSNPTGPATDQRGKGRTSGPATDIGAYERQVPGVAAVGVNNGAVQRSRVTTISVTFDGVVSLAATAFTLARPAYGTTSPAPATLVSGTPAPGQGTILVSTAVVGTATVATLTFGTNAGSTTAVGDGVEYGSLSDGAWVLTVSAAGVTGGDSANMAADFATDNTPGSLYSVTGRLYRLFGDHDGDADVDTLNAGQFRQTFGSFSTNTTSPLYNPSFDFDGDGDVDTVDAGRFRQRFGSQV